MKNKKILAATMTSFILASSLSAQLLITGVFDASLSGGTPKGIELYATADVADLSTIGVGSANNGGGSDSEEFTLEGSATAGEFIYISSESAQFTNWFGFAPTFTTNAMGINGDDAIELFSNGVVIDTFGDINVDGSGEAWDYLDGWAYRNSGSVAGAFVVSDWSFSGTNALDGETTNSSATSAIPIGTYSVPEPSTFALLAGMFALASVMVRRRSLR